MKIATILGVHQGVGSTNEALTLVRHRPEIFLPVASQPIGGKPGVVPVDTLFKHPIWYPIASLMDGLDALDREVGLDGVLICTIGAEVFNSLPKMTWPTVWRYNINPLEFCFDPGMASNIPAALGTLGLVDAVVPCTKFVEDNLKQLGVENTKIIPTCLDTKECMLAKPTSDLVVSLMRIAPIKNVFPTSLLAMGKVVNELPTAEYKIYGAGVMADHVASWVRAMRSDRISYMGYKPANEILPHAKVALQMSISENFSLSALEFLASGVPLVCSDIPGHPRSACRVNFDSVKEAYEAVKRLLTDDEYWEAKRREGLEEAKQYDVSKIVPRWLELFETLQKLKEFKKKSRELE